MKNLLTLLAIVVFAMIGSPLLAEESEKLTFETPILITDLGQGNTSKMVEIMIKREGEIEYATKDLAKAEDLGNAKTLVIGVGASTKGLGAAGLDIDQEMGRGVALMAAAKEKGIPIIGVHMGGVARRGELSDNFNTAVFNASKLFIVWQGGNEDGFFTNLSKETGIPLLVAEKKTDVGTLLVDALKKHDHATEKEGEHATEKAGEHTETDEDSKHAK